MKTPKNLAELKSTAEARGYKPGAAQYPLIYGINEAGKKALHEVGYSEAAIDKINKSVYLYDDLKASHQELVEVVKQLRHEIAATGLVGKPLLEIAFIDAGEILYKVHRGHSSGVFIRNGQMYLRCTRDITPFINGKLEITLAA